MQDNSKIKAPNIETMYKIMLIKLEGLLSSEQDWLANISNATALLYTNLDNVNWAGFYFLKNGELVLGSFQGKTACTRIKLGSGVCGTAVEEKKTMLVTDVSTFEGHIACDCATKSELVVPIIKDDMVYGVLDIDSPIKNRFNDIDEKYVKAFVEKLNKYIDWNNTSQGY